MRRRDCNFPCPLSCRGRLAGLGAWFCSAAFLLVFCGSSGAQDSRDAHHQHGSTAPVVALSERVPLGSEFHIRKVFEAPLGFAGNLTYDPASQRLWLLSYGPPANVHGLSILYQLDPENGRVLRQAQMPFVGEIGPPAFAAGVLHQIVAHQSKLYKISVAEESFGDIVKTISLPTLNDIEFDESIPLRFPFISFHGVTATSEENLLVHAQDLGEFFTLDGETGVPLERVPTLRTLNGIAAVSGPRGEHLILANSDPVKATFEYEVRRYKLRSSHGVVPAVRYGKKAIHWVLLDSNSGEVLASIRRLEPRAEAQSVALISHQEMPGATYGRFTFFATGEEGIFILEWTPGVKS